MARCYAPPGGRGTMTGGHNKGGQLWEWAGHNVFFLAPCLYDAARTKDPCEVTPPFEGCADVAGETAATGSDAQPGPSSPSPACATMPELGVRPICLRRTQGDIESRHGSSETRSPQREVPRPGHVRMVRRSALCAALCSLDVDTGKGPLSKELFGDENPGALG